MYHSYIIGIVLCVAASCTDESSCEQKPTFR